MSPWYIYPVFLLALGLVGGGNEEPSWRGFAFPSIYSPPGWAWFWVDRDQASSIFKDISSILIVGGLATVAITMTRLGLLRSFGQEVSLLKVSGPYRVSRNPQILGGALLIAGVFLLRPSWYALGWMILCATMLHMMVLTEEEHLRDAFGQEYIEYCQRVPRYLGIPKRTGETMTKERRYDIDWLRVIAMLAVFLFHCTRFFDTEGWHLKNADQSTFLFISLRALVWPWVMELFFLLSGVGTWYALKSRNVGAYLWERTKRLLIPLYTVGLFLLLPPQFYFEMLTNMGYRGNFWQVIPRYFAAFRPPRITPWPDTLLPMPFSGHLWFLSYLFMISLLTLPLLLYLKSGQGQRRVARLAGWAAARGGIFLFVLPLALALIGLRGLFAAQRSWADFLWYAIYFVIGYIIPADERFTDAIKRHGWVCLALWLVGFSAGIGLLVLVLSYDPFPGHETFSWMYVAYQIVWSLSSWSAVVFLLSMGARYLNYNHKVLAYANEAVLPFYLFHQTVILAVGFFVIRWDMDILPKLLIVTAVSFPLTLALYELLVRRFNVVRFLFGMRPRKQPVPPTQKREVV